MVLNEIIAAMLDQSRRMQCRLPVSLTISWEPCAWLIILYLSLKCFRAFHYGYIIDAKGLVRPPLVFAFIR